MPSLADILTRELRCLLDQFDSDGGAPAPLTEVALFRDDYYQALRVTLFFGGREACRGFMVYDREVNDQPRPTNVVRLQHMVERLWWRCYEDHRINRETRQMRAALAQRIDAALTNQIAGEPRAVTAQDIQEYIEEREAEVRELERHAARYHRPQVGSSENTWGTRLNSSLWQLVDVLSSWEEPSDPEAEKRALDLLRSNLTPKQRDQYDRLKSFEVVGSDTGKRYRIRHGRQTNIDELTEAGEKRNGWCFLPVGGLVAADCVLAQKIALETEETKALAVANKF